MSYLAPAEFSTKMVHVGKSKIFMLPRDTVIRTLMTCAIVLLAAVFAISISVSTGSFLLGAVLFPVGLCTLYLMGFGFYW
jgi:formate/nitrite transporter FocA (FNT family)